ncbi:hypothetical protein KIL84_013530 [Mauremys mutica]|uniref:Uncharacterized protein n=1 Tax=Mauremys mutica TaxID=74926 RepID=A0A9D3WXU8_9SAUR|nr:hypothetical protein KIL84_013530 [Mauremys mutica]
MGAKGRGDEGDCQMAFDRSWTNVQLTSTLLPPSSQHLHNLGLRSYFLSFLTLQSNLSSWIDWSAVEQVGPILHSVLPTAWGFCQRKECRIRSNICTFVRLAQSRKQWIYSALGPESGKHAYKGRLQWRQCLS